MLKTWALFFPVPFSLLESDICVTLKCVYCCIMAEDSDHNFLSILRNKPLFNIQVPLCADTGHDLQLLCQINPCAEKGAMPQMQLSHMLLASILHVERW